ncbi:capsular polysaccharide biosynthesis protein [Evansella vedderi]|uniref:Capsular polysaccharide biosynthesis protein n=1 Tax=Evansella vedderi TaxID=38282 RepID=A0ABT9ZU97_9BACI|nr:Wzz/FepE/Etk N-terminal domain-containing protein [Evansella vedderi]MDQ0254454.1 capsular polysaccharide biosynthesis protein [Evansella vedderi]
MEETISLREIFDTLKKRLSLIIIISVAAVAIAGLISYYLLTPMYQASTQILVNQSKEEGQALTQGDLRTNIELINTYNVIITSPRILEPVKEELQLTRSVGAIRNQIRVGSQNNSQVVYIQVEDSDPAMAVQIANTVATVFQRDIVEIMNVDNVSILSAAELSDNPSPVSPNPTLNMAIALVVGLMAGVGLAFLLEFLDRTLKTEEQLEKTLGIPVLGTISSISDKNVEVKKLTFTRRNRTGRENIEA